MVRELNDRLDHIAESALLKLVARLGMAIALPLIIVGTQWGGSKIWDITDNVSKMQAQTQLMTYRLELLSTGNYSTNDALRDLKLRDQAIDQLQAAYLRMERRIENLEQEIRRQKQ